MAKPSPAHAGNPALVALGKAIRRKRREIGISQEGLALETGLDRSYVGGVERGEHNIAIINLLKISESLGIPCGILLDLAGL
ncbi:MAG: helix-turn-helix domain-containing protein [Burkholderiaceae bacterium]|jgi:transcriptional regulator with XRE-family HTH domain